MDGKPKTEAPTTTGPSAPVGGPAAPVKVAEPAAPEAPARTY
jgi:hypothetical protein